MEVKGSGIPLYYTNEIRLLISQFDLTMHCILNHPSFAPGEKVEPEKSAQCTIVMSPQHAKVQATKLKFLIGEYENQYGQLPEEKPIPKAAPTKGKRTRKE